MKIIEKKQLGFTLLELLFIIVIIGIIVSITVASYQQKTNNLKIDKTALQMQQIMQAATQFRNDNGYWPDSSNPPATFTQNYLPIGSTTNPWGQSFTYNLDTTSDTFQVFSGVTPNAISANRIRSLLPNASINTSNPTQVIFANDSGGMLTDPAIKVIGQTGLLRDGDTFSFSFDCPANQKVETSIVPHYIGAYQYTNQGGGLAHWLCPMGTRGFGTLMANLASFKTTTTNGINHYTYSYVAIFNGTIPDIQFIACAKATAIENAGNVSFTYMGYCLPQ